jgi:hypothetical protein
MPELQANTKRYWLTIFTLGLLLGIGIGYGIFKWQASSVQAKAPIPAPAVASQPPLQKNPPEEHPQAVVENTRRQDGTSNEQRAWMQAFMDRLTPEQRARAGEMRNQVRQNMAEWQNLTPEERQQRMAEIATNTLGMSPESFQRLQSRFNNLTPEQQERWRQRMQDMRDRRNRTPR